MSLPIVCCQCGADMGTDPRDFPSLPDGTMPEVTHGLCPKCVEKAEKEYGLENPKARNVGLMVEEGAEERTEPGRLPRHAVPEGRSRFRPSL